MSKQPQNMCRGVNSHRSASIIPTDLAYAFFLTFFSGCCAGTLDTVRPFAGRTILSELSESESDASSSEELSSEESDAACAGAGTDTGTGTGAGCISYTT